jgi:hypothetical protein
MSRFLPVILALGLIVGAALPASAKPGDDLTFYLDREAYAASLGQALTALEAMARTTPPSQGGMHLNSAYARLHDARDAFNSGQMIQSMEYLAQVIQQVEVAASKGASGASSVADTLALASKRAGHELVQCIYGFTYEGSPHIRNANESLANADTELAAGRRAAAARLYHQAVQKAKVVFEGNNLASPSGGAVEQAIYTDWSYFRQGLLTGEPDFAASVASVEFQERMRTIFASIPIAELSQIAREMRPIQPINQLAPTIWLYTIPRVDHETGQQFDYHVYFVLEPDEGYPKLNPDWKVAIL